MRHYEQIDLLNKISRLIDDYDAWFGEVVFRLIYPEKIQISDIASLHATLQACLEQARSYHVVPFADELTLAKLGNEVQEKAEKILSFLAASREVGRPDEVLFTDLRRMHALFMFQLRRIELGFALEGGSSDALTGLRKKTLMIDDIGRSLALRDRYDIPFVIVVARIDRFDDLRAACPPEDVDQVISAVADVVKNCMRATDDGYRISEKGFLLCFNNTYLDGGIKALNRLRGMLDNLRISVPSVRKDLNVTMSYAVAEPMPTDDLGEVLQTMYRDVESQPERSDVLCEFRELSILQTYIENRTSDGADDDMVLPPLRA